ncbi:hypothetical protein G8759_15565 [Spirosoma aureum]|uniref:DUF3244 domain-containing protein n=2 Tax=Spirosoma aureum TaxID=2692134 RepID=A0A6G9AZE5_9BACT|nr:hypothetical protein G8759_15565 [Spirosoma aureum]
MNKMVSSVLMSTATLANPTTPKALPFDASAFVTINNQIRVAVSKTEDVPVVILLRSSDNQIIYQQSIDKKDANYAVKLNVDELRDGKYELEVASKAGSIRKQLTLSTKSVEHTRRAVTMQ